MQLIDRLAFVVDGHTHRMHSASPANVANVSMGQSIQISPSRKCEYCPAWHLRHPPSLIIDDPEPQVGGELGELDGGAVLINFCAKLETATVLQIAPCHELVAPA